MSRIFISYRREDSAHVAGRIYDHLTSHLPRAQVFKDVDAIPRSANFREAITIAIAECDVLLAVIGNGWLSAKNIQGQPRLSDPEDLVRAELEMAMEWNVPVIPLLIDDMEMPSKQVLPDSLKPLADVNALLVHPDPLFKQDMQCLVRDIKQILKKPKDSFRERALSQLPALGKPSLQLLAFTTLAVGVIGAFIATLVNTTQIDVPIPGNSNDGNIATEMIVPAKIPKTPESQTAARNPAYGQESEPNDLIGNANHFALERPIIGRISRDNEFDMFSFTSPETGANIRVVVRQAHPDGFWLQVVFHDSLGTQIHTERVNRHETVSYVLDAEPGNEYYVAVGCWKACQYAKDKSYEIIAKED